MGGAQADGERRATLAARDPPPYRGIHRDTIRRALASREPPSYGPRPRRPSKLDPFRSEICRLLDNEPTLSGICIVEEITELGYEGGKTILDDLLRALRPRFPAAAAKPSAHRLSPRRARPVRPH